MPKTNTNTITVAVWKTRDGQSIPVPDLKTKHLLNILKLGVRQSRAFEDRLEEALSMIAYSGGDMAEYYTHQMGDIEMERVARMPNPMGDPVWRHLVAEAKTRGLWHELGALGLD